MKQLLKTFFEKIDTGESDVIDIAITMFTGGIYGWVIATDQVIFMILALVILGLVLFKQIVKASLYSRPID
jgi:hypothetical protein